MTRDDCLKNRTSPVLVAGAVVRSGRFFRNLKRQEIAKCYPDDDNDNPQYGFKVKHQHWANAQTRGGLSVNVVSCVHTAACSLLLHPAAQSFQHVAEIDLEALSQRLQVPLVAQYKPEPDNPCHFELLSEEGTILALMKLRDCLEEDFPPGKLPRTSEESRAASEAREAYARMITIHRFPLGQT